MDTIAFHHSTTKELLAIKDRVRNLVFHWGEDGRYKEAVLKSVIQRFLPQKFNIATGFVVKQTKDRAEHLSSKQIDLIIYDTAYPVLFKEGDFAIVTPDAVRAIIEVKANVQTQSLQEVIKKANENGKFIESGRLKPEYSLFNGVFSFDGYEPKYNLETIEGHILGSEIDFKTDKLELFKVNHISFNKDLFYKFWADEKKERSKIYGLENLSFSFFIGNLMAFLSDDSVMANSNLWFPGDKSIKVLKAFD
jgi:hypothetical protein